MTSPRPTPKFYTEAQTFSTKKARATPRDQAPPKPPVKSCPPVSRIFNNIVNYKARAISFKGSDINLSSKHYDENAKELYFEQCFEIHSKLGAGSFGEVFEVKSKEDGKFYAVKRSRERFRGESDRIRKLEEVKKHEELPKHPNCIKFIKAWEERQHLYIQTELCSTSLSNYSEMNHDIPETLIWKYLVDLLLAVKHLHDHELLHLDIKPDNIFISSDGICKLGDFGLVIDLNKMGKFEALEGDPKYLAPEVLDGHFTKAADIFSLGITILELACDLDLPRGGDSWQTLRHGQIPEDMCTNISPALKSVIILMMEPNFKRRSTAAQILNIPQVRKVHKQRSWELKMKLLVSTTICILSYLWVQVMVFGKNFLKPFIWLKTKCINTTKGLGTPLNYSRKPKNPSDWHGWDGSFSDDEVFDDDMNHSNSLGVAPLSDTSTSDESNNGSFYISSVPMRLITNSTPASIKQRSSLRRALMPNRLFDPIPFNLNEQNSSANSVPKSPFSLKIPAKGSSLRKPISSSRRSALFANNSTSVEPRNLMNLFDEANKDDDNTT